MIKVVFQADKLGHIVQKGLEGVKRRLEKGKKKWAS